MSRTHLPRRAFQWAVLSVAITLSAGALAVGSLADINIIDRDTGRTLPVYQHNGQYWVAGTPSNRYAISVRNQTNSRLLAVTSVDGVNVLTGEDATPEQTGYVFNARQNYDINGWRKSDTQIANFNFVASRGSYASQTGRPGNVGVIGVALFREKTYRPPVISQYTPRPYENSADRAKESEYAGSPPLPAPAAESAGADSHAKRSAAPSARVEEKLGTGHGSREYSYVSSTAFERATRNPGEIIQIRYDSYDNLVAMGVIPSYGSLQPRPNPFPASGGGYVPDPPRRW